MSSDKTFSGMIKGHHAVQIMNNVVNEVGSKQDKQRANCCVPIGLQK